MLRSVSVAEAKDQLPRLIREAESGAAVEIQRRGRPVAVLVSTEDYNRIQREPLTVLDAWEAAAARHGPAESNDAEVLEGPRDRSPGPDFDWS